LTWKGERAVFTVYIPSEDHSMDQMARKITGLTTSKEIAEDMLQESFFGELEKRYITPEQWDAMCAIAKQGAPVEKNVRFDS
jgi:HEPN domain-containing protein